MKYVCFSCGAIAVDVKVCPKCGCRKMAGFKLDILPRPPDVEEPRGHHRALKKNIRVWDYIDGKMLKLHPADVLYLSMLYRAGYLKVVEGIRRGRVRIMDITHNQQHKKQNTKEYSLDCEKEPVASILSNSGGGDHII